jgi:cell division protein FtsB
LIVAREKAEYYGLPQLPKEKRQTPGKQGLRLVRKERLALTGMVLLLFCSCMVIAFYYAQVLITGYRLNKAEQELALLRTESHDLYARVNQLSNLEYIEAVAVHRLGMVRPQNDRVVVVEAVEPAGQKPAAGTVAAGEPAKKDDRETAAGARREQNWVIRAFADMVGRLESSIRTG